MTTHLIRVNSSGEVLDAEGRPSGVVLADKKFLQSPTAWCNKCGFFGQVWMHPGDKCAYIPRIQPAARPDIAALAVRVPERKSLDDIALGSPAWLAYTHWNACLDALGIAP